MTQPPPTQQGPMYSVSRELPGATASMVLGIISVVLNFPIGGFIIAFIGFQKAKQAKALSDANPGYYTNVGIAQAGYILSIVGMCLGGLTTLCGCGYFIIIIFAVIGAAAGAGAGGGM